MASVSQSEGYVRSIESLFLLNIQDGNLSGKYQWEGLLLTLLLHVEKIDEDGNLWRADFQLENVVESLLAKSIAITEFGEYFCKMGALLNAVALPYGYESNTHMYGEALFFWIERLDLYGGEVHYASRQEAISGVRALAHALCALDVSSMIDEIVMVK